MSYNQMFVLIKGLVALCGSMLAVFFGGWDKALYTLLILILFDYLTGLIRAVFAKKISSGIGFRGILKKILILMMVGFSHLLDLNLLGGGQVLRTGVIFFYSANEGISVMENLAAIGFPIPEKLKSVLLQMKEEENG